MSIKFWTAYKIPVDRFNDFVEAFDEIALELIISRLCQILEKRKPGTELFEASLELDRILEASAKMFGNPFSVETGFDFILENEFAYILPYGVSCPKPSALGDFVVDYHYQDQVDEDDDEILEEDWAERGETWKRILVYPEKPKISRHISTTARWYEPLHHKDLAMEAHKRVAIKESKK